MTVPFRFTKTNKLRILRRMRELIARPHGWTKWRFENEGGAVCLLGAERKALKELGVSDSLDFSGNKLSILKAARTRTRLDVVLTAVELERQRQEALFEEGRISYRLADITEDDFTKVSVLMEEVGEVARAANDRNLDHLYSELIQVAAVACAFAESIHELREYLAQVEA